MLIAMMASGRLGLIGGLVGVRQRETDNILDRQHLLVTNMLKHTFIGTKQAP